jgi:hypothetical protein
MDKMYLEKDAGNVEACTISIYLSVIDPSAIYTLVCCI